MKYLRTAPECNSFLFKNTKDILFAEQVENSLSLNILYGMYTQIILKRVIWYHCSIDAKYIFSVYTLGLSFWLCVFILQAKVAMIF